MPLKFTPNPKAPNVLRSPSSDELEELFKPYAHALGALVYAWNRLQERFARLFSVVGGFQDGEVGQAIWFSTLSDLNQRKMLRAATESSKSITAKQREDILWALKKTDHFLSEKRNDALHTPFSFLTDAFGTRLAPDFFSSNPKARRLFNTELLAEFKWYAETADALSAFVDEMTRATNPTAPLPWPEKPQLPHLGQKMTLKPKTPGKTYTRLQLRSGPSEK